MLSLLFGTVVALVLFSVGFDLIKTALCIVREAIQRFWS